jgi:ADP-ribosylglycohydrolase
MAELGGQLPGNPTDDSEMVLVLARMLIKQRRYDAEEARKAYVFWLNSSPFDCGITFQPDFGVNRIARAKQTVR